MSDTAAATDLGSTVAKLLDPERRRMVLAAVAAQAENEYRQEPSSARLGAWEAALSRLESFEVGRGGSLAPADDAAGAPKDETCATTREAADYLREHGWKVGKTKIAESVKNGLLARNAQGLFPQSTLDAWAKKHCVPLAGVVNRDERLEKLAERKMAAETELAETRTRLKKLEEREQTGQVIEAAQAYRILAQLTAQLRNDIDNFIYGKVPESVKICRGDDARIPDLIEWWLEAKAQWMNRYMRHWRDKQPMLISRAAIEEALRDLS